MSSQANEQERPLVTFALFAYNQERFIREAVEGAFSQDYSPLQIILSDDCSSDRTFEIMQEMAAAYDGPHEIVLNKNGENLGIGGHVRKLSEMAEGDVIVMAAGDDVSERERASRLIEVYRESSDVYAVFSGAYGFDQSGKPLGLLNEGAIYNLSREGLARRGGGTGMGATYSYRREVFFWPNRYPVNCYSEDRLLPFRASILGRVEHIRMPLVWWRLSDSSTSANPSYIRAQARQDHVALLLETLIAAEQSGHLSSSERKRLGRTIQISAKLRRWAIGMRDNLGRPGAILYRILDLLIPWDALAHRLKTKLSKAL